MRWSDALSTVILTMRGFTGCFRSVRDIRTPCADRTALADVDNEGALQGHRRAMEMPDHHTPLARRRLCEQVVGGYDR